MTNISDNLFFCMKTLLFNLGFKEFTFFNTRLLTN